MRSRSVSHPSIGHRPRRRIRTLALVPAVALPLVALPAAVMTAAPAAAAPTAQPKAKAAGQAPNVGKLAGALAKQKLTWETCDFGSAALNDRFNQPNVKCATVTVPQDWKDPANGKTFSIRISQAHNIDVKNPRYQGTIFANPGGPGGSGLVWGPALQERTPDLNPYYNYIGFDPRGVGQSSTPSCDYTWDSASTDPNAELKAIAATCGKDPAIRAISTEQTTYDMDFIRYLLKAPKLSYIGYSYGTWLGAWYENVFGATYGGRFLLDSSTDVTQPTLQRTWDLQPIARDRQFQMRMMNWIARNDATFGLGDDPRAIYQRYFDATATLDPGLVYFVWAFFGGASAFSSNDRYPAAGSVVQLLIQIGEEPEEAARLSAVAAENPAAAVAEIAAKRQPQARSSAPAPQQGLLQALSQLPTKDQVQARSRKAAPAAAETGTFSDAFDMIRCNDGQWTQGAAYWDAWNAKTAKKAPLSAQWGIFDGPPLCAFWRTNTMMPVATNSFPNTIVAQAELDSQTGWETGRTSGVKLPNTSFMAIDNEGSHGEFPYGTEAFDRPIINYFLTGKQPKNITVTQALPLPGDEVTYEDWGKLNKAAKHVPVNPGPWVPAGPVGKRSATSDAGSEQLAEMETNQLLRQRVSEIYGQAGVDLLKQYGR